MSINKNWVNAALSSEEVEVLVTGLKGIEDAVPFAVTLNKDERAALPRVGPKTMDFVDKALEYAERNPGLVPTHVDVSEFKEKRDLVYGLKKVLNHTVPLETKLKDSLTLAQADSYETARQIYHNTKNGARVGVPGASAVAAELGKLYENNGPKKGSPEPGTDETPAVPSEPVTEVRAA